MNTDRPQNSDEEVTFNECMTRKETDPLGTKISVIRLSDDGKHVLIPTSSVIARGLFDDGASKKEPEERKLPATLYLMVQEDGEYLGSAEGLLVFFCPEDGRKVARIILPTEEARRCRSRPTSTMVLIQYAYLGNIVVVVDKVSKKQYRQTKLFP